MAESVGIAKEVYLLLGQENIIVQRFAIKNTAESITRTMSKKEPKRGSNEWFKKKIENMKLRQKKRKNPVQEIFGDVTKGGE